MFTSGGEIHKRIKWFKLCLKYNYLFSHLPTSAVLGIFLYAFSLIIMKGAKIIKLSQKYYDLFSWVAYFSTVMSLVSIF